MDLYIGFPADVVPHAGSGNLKVCAVAANARLAAAPQIPTSAEAGLSEFAVSGWFALWGPKGDANERVAKLNFAMADALSNEAVKRRLEQDLFIMLPVGTERSSDALSAFQKDEIRKWWPLLKASQHQG